MRTSKVKPKKKFTYKPSIIKASFKRKVDIAYIHKLYREQIGHDEAHRLNAGGWGWYGSCDTNPIFTSRNSHKQTNK